MQHTKKWSNLWKFKVWYVCYDQTHHSMQKFWSKKHLNKKSKFWSKEDLVDKMGLWQNDKKCSEWSDFLTDGGLWSHKATAKIWGHLDKLPSLGGHFGVSVPNRKMHATCSKKVEIGFFKLECVCYDKTHTTMQKYPSLVEKWKIWVVFFLTRS